MPVSSVTGDTAVQALFTAATANKSVKTEQRVTGQSLEKQAVKPATVDPATKSLESPEKKLFAEAESDRQKSTERTMSHVVETYSPKGKLVIKFVDSNNNVLYQIPPEMVTKIEDQMTKSKSSTDIKA